MNTENGERIVALSIRQPWAWLILRPDLRDPESRAAAGIYMKDVENRTWRTRYRGPLYIHAGRGFDHEGYEWVIDVFQRRIPKPSGYARGGIVGRVELVDCVTASDSPWFFGPFGFVLRNATPLPLMPCPGKLGLFRPAISLPTTSGLPR